MIKVHKTLLLLEKQKYMQPFFSETIEPLVQYLKSHQVILLSIIILIVLGLLRDDDQFSGRLWDPVGFAVEPLKINT
jgi:hypothetical protein